MSSSSKYSQTGANNIQAVFSPSGRKFLVPKFQRNYSWTDEKVEPLWTDFLETFQSYLTTSDPHAAQYLLGPVVFVKKGRFEFQVIDGQQRLATLTLLFCLARDVIIQIKKPGSGETPDGLSDLIRVTENQSMGQRNSWKLTLNDSDKKMLNEIQHYEKDVHHPQYQNPQNRIDDWNARKKDPATRDEFTDSIKKIINAYKLLYEKITDALYTNFQSGTEVEEILKKLEKKAEDNVDQKMKEHPDDYGLEDTFYEDLQKLISQDFSDDERDQYERERQRKNRTTKRFPDLDSYIERLIDKKNRKLKNLKKQEIDNEKNLLKTEAMNQNLPTFIQFFTHVLENNFLVEIVVEDDEDAFQIFETLNERGLPLSKSNLIKNHIISLVPNEQAQEDISDEWNQIFDEIIGTKQGDDVFIRESLRSRYFDEHTLDGKKVKASKKLLYKIVKARVNDDTSARKFVSELRIDSKVVRMLNDPTQYPDGKTKNAIIAVQSLNGESIRIPILTGYREWGIDDDRYDKLVNFLVKFFFRYRTVSVEHPGEVDRLMIECARKIKQNEKVEDIINFLKENDDEDTFLWNFENTFEPNEQVANYVLSQITLHLGTPWSDVQPVGHLSVEHILPKKPDKSDWKTFFDNYDGSTRHKLSAFTYKIGNQTLLTQPINSAVSNKGFLEKKNYENNGQPKGYNSSELAINLKTVMNYQDWTASIIEERTQEFTKHAKEIWSLD